MISIYLLLDSLVRTTFLSPFAFRYFTRTYYVKLPTPQCGCEPTPYCVLYTTPWCRYMTTIWCG